MFYVIREQYENSYWIVTVTTMKTSIYLYLAKPNFLTRCQTIKTGREQTACQVNTILDAVL